ncbi:hypothetical protein Tco_0914000, partial [Tanacetum coccineum]
MELIVEDFPTGGDALIFGDDKKSEWNDKKGNQAVFRCLECLESSSFPLFGMFGRSEWNDKKGNQAVFHCLFAASLFSLSFLCAPVRELSLTLPFFTMENANLPSTNNPPVLPTALRAKIVQELNELQAISTYIDSHLENIDQLLNGF